MIKKKDQPKNWKNETLAEELENVETGENHEERIVDDSRKHGSLRHDCKGRGCDTAFEKL